MKNAFKRIDAWGQLLSMGISIAITPFVPSVFLYSYLLIGSWQLVSGTIYLFRGTSIEKLHRKPYWISLLAISSLLIACTLIKTMGLILLYVLWFGPMSLAIWYLVITIREANIFSFLSKNQ